MVVGGGVEPQEISSYVDSTRSCVTMARDGSERSSRASERASGSSLAHS